MDEQRLAGSWENRATVLEAAVVGEDDVQNGLRQIRREVGNVFDASPDGEVAARDLADQLAGVVQLDSVLVTRVGVELANVVQQRAADR